MLESKWETYATQLANSDNDDALTSTLNSLIATVLKESNIEPSKATKPKVVIGRDTRPSGVSLAEAAKIGAAVFSAEIVDIGIVTTPQTHYIVRSLNTSPPYGTPTEPGYFDKFSKAYISLVVRIPSFFLVSFC